MKAVDGDKQMESANTLSRPGPNFNVFMYYHDI